MAMQTKRLKPQRASRLLLAGITAAALTSWAGAASAASDREQTDFDGNGLIEIYDREDLEEIANDANGWSLYGETTGCPIDGCHGFELMNDIDLSTAPWVTLPLLSGNGLVSGIVDFEGNGMTLSGLHMVGNGPAGLFDSIEEAHVRNFQLDGVNVSPGANRAPSGALAASVFHSVVSGVGAQGAITAGFDSGGLIGTCESSDILESYAAVDFFGDFNLGGLVGVSEWCIIRRSFATGRLSNARPTRSAGGLVGVANDSIIEASFATGNVIGYLTAGGLVGASARTTIIFSYATGYVESLGDSVGGLLGLDNGGTQVWGGYWATDTSGLFASADEGLGLTLGGLQCADMASPGAPCAPGLYAGWYSMLNLDGNPAWDFGTSQQLPGLNLGGTVYRDADGDGTLDSGDDFPLQYSATKDNDGDGAHDRWTEGCDATCREVSGLVLDQFVNNDAAAVDLDLDGLPEHWNAGCDASCQSASGLLIDTLPNDFDNDSVSDAEDERDIDPTNNLSNPSDVDANSNGLVDIEDLNDLDWMRYAFDGSGQRSGETAPLISFGCPPMLHEGVLVRRCRGYELLNDLNFDPEGDGHADNAFYNGGEGWLPVGIKGENRDYTIHDMTFEGNGYTIFNLMIDRGTQGLGLFARTAGRTTIQNVGFAGNTMSLSSENGQELGALVGIAGLGTTISGVWVTGPVAGGSLVGSIVGSAEGAQLDGCFSTGSVSCSSDYCGGIVGSLSGGGVVEASFSTGNVAGTGNSIGGLVGQISEGSWVRNSYSTGEVTGAQIGGLVGASFDGLASESSYWDTTNGPATSADDAVGVPIDDLMDPENSVTPLFVGWENLSNGAGNPYWDLGAEDQLPGLCIAGTLYRPEVAGGLEDPTPCDCTLTDVQFNGNDTFELDASGWSGLAATISSSNLQALDGMRSLRIENRTAAWNGAQFNLLGLADRGDMLDARLGARVEGSPSETVLFTLRHQCSGGGMVFTNIASGTATDTGWVELNGTFDVPDCSLNELVVYAEGPAAGRIFYIDDVLITRRTLTCGGGGGVNLGASFDASNDWGTGYCAVLTLSNPTSQATVGWEASFNVGGGTIYTMWNMDRVGNTGNVTVTPGGSSFYVIPAGGTSHSLGFCVDRPAGDTSSVPTAAVAIGEF